MKRPILASILLITINTIYSQVISLSPLQDSTTLYEKLYLHIDREIYSPGDDIWFKSYLVSGINHQFVPGFKNIYVQLISEKGDIIDNRLMLSINGEANNDFHLSDSLSEGSYTIRAFTKYLQNFGEESLFHKKIMLAKASESPVIRKEERDNKIDVSFLPEGGNLVLNAANHIGFKAIDESGKGIAVSGKIVNEAGETVTQFTTKYNGMGSFVMMPQEGEMYYAKIDDYPDFNYKFEDVKNEGIALHYQPKESNLVFTLSRNFKSTGIQNYSLAVWHKNQEVFNEDIEMTEFQNPVEIYKGFFPEGISKITLYDKQQNILAERLIFVRNEDKKTLKIKTDKNEYGTREKGVIDITSVLDYDDTIQNTLSVAIVSEDYFDEGGNSQTIESYLLLDSELKGPLESPASYFTDEDDITADEKLDLVMQVNGWRRYYWDDLQNYDWQHLPNWDDAGLTIQGKVTTLFGGKPVKNGIVKFGPFSGLFTIMRDTTNEKGEYRFDRLFMKDSAVIMINATNEKGRKGVEITDETPPVFDSLVALNEINKTNNNITLPKEFYRASYFRHLAEKEFELEEGSILLGVVDVVEDKFDPVEFARRMYGSPDNTLDVMVDDWTYNNIFEYLEANSVAGLVVTDVIQGQISIRSGSSPNYLVDGLPRSSEYLLYNLPMSDVDKIDILKSGYSAAFFGSTGSNGTISIITRTGFGAFSSEFKRIVHGKITPEYTGFRQAREFYAPKYPLNRLEELSDRKPDFRPTLYWNPYVDINKGKAELEFSTSDMLGSYRVIVEGISANGKVCCGTTLLDVGAPGN